MKKRSPKCQYCKSLATVKFENLYGKTDEERAQQLLCHEHLINVVEIMLAEYYEDRQSLKK